MTMSLLSFVVALGAAFSANGSRISPVNQQMLQGGALVADEVTRDQTIQTTMGISPHLEELKKWAAFYSTPEGGSLDNAKSLVKAEEMLSRKHPDLEELKEWHRKHPDLEELKEWQALYFDPKGGNLIYRKALAKAEEMLSRKHPDLEELKKWQAFYSSREGGNHLNENALSKAEEMLSRKHPDLEELMKWQALYSPPGVVGLGNAAALAKAEEMLSRKHPDREELKKWQAFYSSSEGGGVDYNISVAGIGRYSTALVKAEEMLSRNPDLEELMKWQAFYSTPEGGGLDNAQALAKAEETLSRKSFVVLSHDLGNGTARNPRHSGWKLVYPDLEELKQWAAFYSSPEAYNLNSAEALAKAQEMLTRKHPFLEELKNDAAYLSSPKGGGLDKAKALAQAEESSASRLSRSGLLFEDGTAGAGDGTPGVTPAKKATMPCAQPDTPEHGSAVGDGAFRLQRPCSEQMDQVADGATCTTQCEKHFTPQPRSLTCVEGNIGKYVCVKVPSEWSCWAECYGEGKDYKYIEKHGSFGTAIQCECHGRTPRNGPPEHLRLEQARRMSESGAHTDKWLGVCQLFWVSLMLAFGMYDLSH